VNKTSVYLDDDDTARLRRLQAETGRSQSELIREAIRALADDGDEPPPPLTFIGKGSWPVDDTTRRWDADELARRRGLA
jgi:hypothetical protein